MYLLWACTNPRRINGTDVYSREAFIQGNTVHIPTYVPQTLLHTTRTKNIKKVSHMSRDAVVKMNKRSRDK